MARKMASLFEESYETYKRLSEREEFQQMLAEIPDSEFRPKPGDDAPERKKPRPPSASQRNADRARCARHFANQSVSRIKAIRQRAKTAQTGTLH